MGRKGAAAAAAAEIAFSESRVGRHLSIPESSTLISKKRRSSRVKKSTETSENPPTPAGSMRHIDTSLANYGGKILVLFETPSGFAIFCLKYDLNQPDVMEKIWAIFVKDYRSREIVCLKEFRTFKDKSSAFNHGTGVSKELTEMILRHHRLGETLAVGKPEYKRLIETHLWNVPCLFNETVMEVMWGLENVMRSLVPQEKVKLPKEDRLPMCQGIKIFLNRYNVDVKLEMVDEEVLETACILVDAELIEKTNSEYLQWAAGKLKDLSGINPKEKGWDTLRIAKALKIMFEPILTTQAEMELFSREEISTLMTDADKYEDLIRQDVLELHNELVETREVKKNALKQIRYLLKIAEEGVRGEADPIYFC